MKPRFRHSQWLLPGIKISGWGWHAVYVLMHTPISRLAKVRITSMAQWQLVPTCKAAFKLPSDQAATEVELFHGTRSRKPEEVYRSEYEFDFRLSSLNALWGTVFHSKYQVL